MEKTRCPGCMKLKTSGPVCEHCGFDEQNQNAPHQLAIGTVLKEQYQIGKVLGQGGFGITYLGWDLYLDIPVAIKEYYPGGMVMRETTVTMAVADISGGDGSRFRNNRDRFMREAKMLARFSQVPSVVQVKNFFLANNTAYIVMEFVEGITLKQHVKNRGGKLSVEETFAILGPVIETMAKVHKTGIIHRDISPANIMMVEGGAKVLDFGAVRDVSTDASGSVTKSTEAIITQGYAPMEQYLGKGLGSWTDVYALCATIYYCLVGEVPPDAPTRILENEDLKWDSIAGLTQKQKEALIHGLQLRSDDRTRTMDELHRELFAKPEPVISDPVIPESVIADSVISKPIAPVSEIYEPTRPEPIQPEPPKPQPPKPQPPKPQPPKPRPPKPRPPKPEPVKPEKPANEKKEAKGKWALIGVAIFAIICLFSAVAIGLNRTSQPDYTGPVISSKNRNVVSGRAGESVIWELNLDTGAMYITGGGVFHDFYGDWYSDWDKTQLQPQPWAVYRNLIREVYFTGTVENVGQAAFAGCQNLTKVEFNEYVTSIGSDAFNACLGLAELTLPESLDNIQWYSFCNTSLREVTIPMNVAYIGGGAFAHCPNLERVNLQSHTRWDYNIQENDPVFCKEGREVSSITLCGPSGGIVEDYAGILGYQFESNGKQVRYEGQGDFSEFPGNVDGRWYYDRDTCFLKIEGEMPTDMVGSWEINSQEVGPDRKDVPQMPWRGFREEIEIVSIGQGVTRLCDNAFENIHSLRSIYIPDSVVSIGFQTFLNTCICEIYIPDSVADIESFAFNYCTNLNTVRLPLGLKQLKRSVFNVNPNLERVYMGNVTEFECREEQGMRVTPFNNQDQPGADWDEGAMPERLTIYTPQERAGDQVSPAKIFADEYGVGYGQQIYHQEGAWECGDVVFGQMAMCWSFENGILRILGSGETPFFRAEARDKNAWGERQPDYMLQQGDAPWYHLRNEIYAVEVDFDIYSLNRGALRNMPNLQDINLGGMYRIYEGAIDNCGMHEVWLIGDWLASGAIRDCANLKTLHFDLARERIEDGVISGCDNLRDIYFPSGEEALNPNGELFDGWTPKELTIWTRLGAPAQKYAEKHNIYFSYIKD